MRRSRRSVASAQQTSRSVEEELQHKAAYQPAYFLRNRQQLQTAWTEEAHNVILSRKRPPVTTSATTTNDNLEINTNESASRGSSLAHNDVEYLCKVMGALITSLIACLFLLLLATHHSSISSKTDSIPASALSLPDLRPLLNLAETARKELGTLQRSRSRAGREVQEIHDLLIGFNSKYATDQQQWYFESTALEGLLAETRASNSASASISDVAEHVKNDVAELESGVASLSSEISNLYTAAMSMSQINDTEDSSNVRNADDLILDESIVSASSSDERFSRLVNALHISASSLIDAAVADASDSLVEDLVMDAVPDALQHFFGNRNSAQVSDIIQREILALTAKPSAPPAIPAAASLVDVAAAVRGGRVLMVPHPYMDMIPAEKSVYVVSSRHFTSPPYYPSAVTRIMGTLLGTAPTPLYSIDPHIIISHQQLVGGYAMRGTCGNITLLLSEVAQIKRIDLLQPIVSLPSLTTAEPQHITVLGWRQIDENIYVPSSFAGMDDAHVATLLSDSSAGAWINLAYLNIQEDCHVSTENEFLSCPINSAPSISAVMLMVEDNKGNENFSLLYRVRIMA